MKISNKASVFLLLAFVVTFKFYGQENWNLKGYVKGMTAMQSMNDSSDMTIENTIYNRLNIDLYINENFIFNIGMRNRIIAGNNVSDNPDYSDYLSGDNGYFDFSLIWANKKSWIGLLQLDRLYIDYTIGNLQITLGRQRINWGQSFVWNPNDLFNSYSYFDFDYEEKPGSDAIRMQYYIGESGKIELSTSINAENKITSALLYRFNTQGYDIQFLGGVYAESDYVIGCGWSGSIGGGGFNGELTYYHPIKNYSESKGTILATIHYDYTFSNSLNLQFEALYNGFGADDISGGIKNIIFMDLGPKNLFLTKVGIFGSGGFDLSLLTKVNLSGMYGPEGNFMYVGPTITYSISNAMELAAIGQYFSMKIENESFANSGNSIFLRLKWAF